MEFIKIVALFCLFPIASHVITFISHITQLSKYGKISEVKLHWVFNVLYLLMPIILIFANNFEYWWVSVGIILIQYVISFIAGALIIMITKSMKLVIFNAIILNFLCIFGFLYVLLNEWYFGFNWSPF
ncbi:MAG: hypothetical protein ACOCVF_03495 [bacterium]